MLKNTFIHIPGIGHQKEQLLWQNKIATWDDFLTNNIKFLPKTTTNYIRKNIEISKKQYKKQNHLYFSQSLPMKEHWRAYPDFSTCFLDIETTGLSKHRNKITTIGIHDGKDSKVFIRGMNLHRFAEEIKNYSTIITFNGARFDLPFIKEKFPEIKFDQLHIDLMYTLRELGYTGGLKRIEKILGIGRDDEIDGVDGFEAVRLWKKYEKGDSNALKKLVAYNLADVENLKILMNFVFKKKTESIT